MKRIDNYEDYAITKEGNVFSFKRSKLNPVELKPIICRGYLRVFLSKNGVAKNFKIHRLVAQHFLENPEKKKTVNHKNGIKTDNNVENLQWNTLLENINHAYSNDLINNKGENCHLSKLNYGKVYVIKILLKRGNILQKDIADFFNVNSVTISDINVGKSWSHLKIKIG